MLIGLVSSSTVKYLRLRVVFAYRSAHLCVYCICLSWGPHLCLLFSVGAHLCDNLYTFWCPSLRLLIYVGAHLCVFLVLLVAIAVFFFFLLEPTSVCT